MKKQLNEIKNADVSSMDRTQLDTYRNKLQTFKSKTAFFCNTKLIKLIYLILGYSLGITIGVLFAKTLLYGIVYRPYIITMVVLLVVCVVIEILYRTAKSYGEECSKCILEKTIQVKNQYALIAPTPTTEKTETTTETTTEKEQPEKETAETNQNDEQAK